MRGKQAMVGKSPSGTAARQQRPHAPNFKRKAMTLFVMMYDPTQQICPVEAESPEAARVLIAKKLGISAAEAAAWPLYDADNAADIKQIISIVADAAQKGE